MGHCKVKYSLCSVQQVWWGLLWGLRQGWAGGFQGVQFCRFVEISRGGGSTRQPLYTEPWLGVYGQFWSCHGHLQGQIQPLQCAAAVVKPALGAAAGPGRWLVEVAVLVDAGVFQLRRCRWATTLHRALPMYICPFLVMPWLLPD